MLFQTVDLIFNSNGKRTAKTVAFDGIAQNAGIVRRRSVRFSVIERDFANMVAEKVVLAFVRAGDIQQVDIFFSEPAV